jgi:hypothetical protein
LLEKRLPVEIRAIKKVPPEMTVRKRGFRSNIFPGNLIFDSYFPGNLEEPISLRISC